MRRLRPTPPYWPSTVIEAPRAREAHRRSRPEWRALRLSPEKPARRPPWPSRGAPPRNSVASTRPDLAAFGGGRAPPRRRPRAQSAASHPERLWRPSQCRSAPTRLDRHSCPIGSFPRPSGARALAGVFLGYGLRRLDPSCPHARVQDHGVGLRPRDVEVAQEARL